MRRSILAIVLALIIGLGTLIPAAHADAYSVSKFSGSFSNDWGRNSVTVYYPTSLKSTPCPAVIFAGGWMGFNFAYNWVGQTLASQGIVTAIIQVPNLFSTNVQQWADGLKGGITWLQAQNSASSKLNGMISGTFGVAGHSMGGAGVLLAASQDSRISAVVSMAPPSPNMTPSLFSQLLFSSMPSPQETFGSVYQAAKLIRVPVLIIAGNSDTIVSPLATKDYYPVLSTTKEFVEITGVGHLDYTDIFSNASYLQTIEQYTRNWFDYYLKGNTSTYTYMFVTGAQNDLASGVLSDLEFEPN
jgi:predicted dienelactone hydrolase